MRSLFFAFVFIHQLFQAHAQFEGKGYQADTIVASAFGKLHNTAWVWDDQKLYIGSPVSENEWHVAEFSASLSDHTLEIKAFISAYHTKSGTRVPLKKPEKFWKSLKDIKFILSPEGKGFILSYQGCTLFLKPYKDIIGVYLSGTSLTLRNKLTGKQQGATLTDIKNLNSFSESGIAVFESSSGKFGLLNIQGKIIADPEYLEIEDNLSHELFRYVKKVSDTASIITGQEKDEVFLSPFTLKTGFFKPDGTVFPQVTFDYLNHPNEHGIIFGVNENQLYAFHKNGAPLPRIPAARMQVGKYLMTSSHGRRDALASFYTLDGKLLTDTVYYRIEPFDKQSGFRYLRVYYQGQQAIYNEQGKQLFPYIPSHIGFSFGFFTVSMDGSDWFMKEIGKNAFGKEFESITPFAMAADSSRIYSCVRLNGKYGVIDTTGEWIIPNEYDEPISFSVTDKYPAKKNGKYGLLDVNGVISAPFQYTYRPAYANGNNYYGFRQGGLWGIAECGSGKIIITPKFDRLSDDLRLAYTGSGIFSINENGTAIETEMEHQEENLPLKSIAPRPLTTPYLKALTVPKQFLKNEFE